MKTLKKAAQLTITAFLLISNVAYGAGGLAAANSQATTFQTWLYGFLGITSVIYLLFKGMQVKAQKATWGDFGAAAMWVAVLGGVPALAAFMWSIFA